MRCVKIAAILNNNVGNNWIKFSQFVVYKVSQKLHLPTLKLILIEHQPRKKLFI